VGASSFGVRPGRGIAIGTLPSGLPATCTHVEGVAPSHEVSRSRPRAQSAPELFRIGESGRLKIGDGDVLVRDWLPS